MIRPLISLLVPGGAAGALLVWALAPATAQEAAAPRSREAPRGEERPEPKAEVRKVEVPAGVKPGGDAEKEARIEEVTRHLRPTLLAELRSTRVACDLNDDQVGRIAREAGRLLEKTAHEVVGEEQVGGQKGSPNSSDSPGPCQRIQQGMAPIVKAHVSPQQWARYQEEGKRRAAHRKQTAIRNLLVKLDRSLALTAEQRARIGEALGAHWNPAWCSPEVFFDKRDSFPNLPDSAIIPFLTPIQREVWKKLEKQEEPVWDMTDIAAELMQGFPAEESPEPVRRVESGARP
jgi:hypothetical protein